MKKTGNTNNGLFHIIIIVIVLAVGGLCAWGFFTVKHWARHASIEWNEQPIQYQFIRMYDDSGIFDSKDDKEVNYYMDVAYKGSTYKVDLGSREKDSPSYIFRDTKLYYDPEGKDVFIEHKDTNYLITTILTAIVVIGVAISIMVKSWLGRWKQKRKAKEEGTYATNKR